MTELSCQAERCGARQEPRTTNKASGGRQSPEVVAIAREHSGD